MVCSGQEKFRLWTATMTDKPKVWSVIDSDNYECSGITSLHWSYEGALEVALKIVAHENILLERGRKPMEMISKDKWYWQHRTVEIEEATINP
jgi:hypothetical protein